MRRFKFYIVLEGPLHHGDQLNSTGQLKVHFGTANDSAEDYYYVQIGASTAAALGVGSGKNINFAIDRTSELAADFVEQWHYSRFGNAELARSVGQVAQQYTEVFFQEAVDETNHRSEISESDWNALSSLQQEDLRRTWGRRAASNLVSSGANGRSGTDSNEMYYNAGSPQGLEPFYSEMQNVDPNLSGSDPSGGIYYENLMNALARESSGPNFLQYSTPDGINISTQENAQRALDAINQAIVSKDKIRANLGAVQNRLENTVTNLSIQSENLMASESRISDVDVSSEMTEFIRNQILTQSATSMLAQANSLPRMAMQLIGG